MWSLCDSGDRSLIFLTWKDELPYLPGLLLGLSSLILVKHLIHFNPHGCGGCRDEPLLFCSKGSLTRQGCQKTAFRDLFIHKARNSLSIHPQGNPFPRWPSSKQWSWLGVKGWSLPPISDGPDGLFTPWPLPWRLLIPREFPHEHLLS